MGRLAQAIARDCRSCGVGGMTAPCNWPDGACAEAGKRAQERRSSREESSGAPQSTVEALMYSLRGRGTKALEEADTKQRLSELNDKQLAEVGDRLRRLKPDIARAWTVEEVKVLIRTRDILNGGRKINRRADTTSARREKDHPISRVAS
jgi:hypothetical protein